MCLDVEKFLDALVSVIHNYYSKLNRQKQGQEMGIAALRYS